MESGCTKTDTSVALKTNHLLFAFPFNVYRGLLVITADAIPFTKKKPWFK